MASTNNASAYKHLRQGARKVVEAGKDVRLNFLYEQRWYGYKSALAVLGRFQKLLIQPRSIRTPSLLLIGDTNNGKSTVVRRFADQYPPMERSDGQGRHIPVLLIQAPPVADERRFYDAILSSLEVPGRISHSTGDKQYIIKTTLAAVSVKILIVDEFLHLICGSTALHRAYHNSIKWLSNELRLSIIGAGIRSAHNSLSSDSQLENRFEIITLPRWTPGDELAQLLITIEGMLPLKEPSGLAKHNELIANNSEVKLGEILIWLRTAAEYAINQGEESITIRTLMDCGWVSPSRRKELLASIT